jgi:toxin-antitoxin system PIN domain toxin
VKLPDANLLLYAYDSMSPLYERARIWFEGLMSGSEPVGFSWLVLVAFIRISTRPSVFENPLSVLEAFEHLENWLTQPCAFIAEPTDRHLAVLRGLLEPLGTAGNLTNDAHLAALAIEHGAEVCSADTDFRRFPGLRWSNPLA